MTKSEKENLNYYLDNGDSYELGYSYDNDDVIAFIESDPKSKTRKYLEDASACFGGAMKFYRYKTVEEALRAIVNDGDWDAIEWFLSNEGVEDTGEKSPADYTAKELIELIPAAYRTKTTTKKGAKKSAKRSSRR